MHKFKLLKDVPLDCEETKRFLKIIQWIAMQELIHA